MCFSWGSATLIPHAAKHQSNETGEQTKQGELSGYLMLRSWGGSTIPRHDLSGTGIFTYIGVVEKC